MSVNAGQRVAWDRVSCIEIEEKDLTDIDQPPETMDEIIEIVAGHYHSAIADGLPDLQDDALESDDDQIVFKLLEPSDSFCPNLKRLQVHLSICACFS